MMEYNGINHLPTDHQLSSMIVVNNDGLYCEYHPMVTWVYINPQKNIIE